MTRFLLDTNVVSEFAPDRRPAPNELLAWLTASEDSLFVSVVTVIEIRSGVLKLQRRSPGARQRALAAWADELEGELAERVLPVTREVAAMAAVVADKNLEQGLRPGWPDIVIAATAAAHGMTLLTRNIRHFAASGVPVIDPFERIPGQV